MNVGRSKLFFEGRSQGIIAINRRGAPLPPSIFIGSAITVEPTSGNLSKFATFSKKGMSLAQRIR